MPADTLVSTLRDIVGADNVLSDSADTAAYLTDWRGRYHGAARAVVRPADTAGVVAVVNACRAAGVPLVAQGGNTGLVGGATPDAQGKAVLLSMQRMTAIRSIDAANNTITVEAGCTLAAVQVAAAAAGRLLPLSLAAEGSCTIGGNLATNAGGVQVLRYGNMRELCLGLEVVLASGEQWDGLRSLRKDNSGLDLKHWFIGSEGTLGVITAAVLKLVPQPTARVAAWLAVGSAADAVAVLSRLQSRFPGRVDSYELISLASVALTLERVPGTVDPLQQAPEAWRVLLELSDGGDDETLRAGLSEHLAHEIEAEVIADAVITQSETQRKALWNVREHVPEAEKRAGFSIKHDISLPVSAIPAFLGTMDARLPSLYPGVQLICFGHLGDGNLHYNLSHPDKDFLARQPEVNQQVFDCVAERGGSIAAEHGVGQLRRQQLLRYRSPLERTLMRAMKKMLDPDDMMNPGKLYPVETGEQ